MSNYTQGPCPRCNSSDAFTVYRNNPDFGLCFSCGKWSYVGDDKELISYYNKNPPKPLFPEGSYRELKSRHISAKTCEHYGYCYDPTGQVQLGPIRDQQGKVVAQRVRRRGKKFSVAGELPEDAMLWGQHLYKNPNKWVLVTEGFEDCMACSEACNLDWPIVSVPNGASSAAKFVKANLHWLLKAEKVIFWFDDDEPGHNALEQCLQFIPIKKRYAIKNTGYKDANEYKIANGNTALRKLIWFGHEQVRPDGLLTGQSLLQRAIEKPTMGIRWFNEDLNRWTFGRHAGKLYGFGGATGCGKTDLFAQSMAFDITELKEPVGVISLEQSPEETVQIIGGKIDGFPYHLPFERNEEQFQKTAELVANNVMLYDNFGETEPEIVFDYLNYFQAEGIRLVYIDHLTAMADTENERSSLEKIMKILATRTDELGLISHYISHLATPEGTPHEEGGKISLRHFKGSRAIGFWSYAAFGLERNQMAENEDEKDTLRVVCLKNRIYGGATGRKTYLKYNQTTTKLEPCDDPTTKTSDEEENDDF